VLTAALWRKRAAQAPWSWPQQVPTQECVKLLLRQLSASSGAGSCSAQLSSALRLVAEAGHAGCLEPLLHTKAAVQLEARPRSQLLTVALRKGVRGGWPSALLRRATFRCL
jgi:hypothetical protein